MWSDLSGAITSVIAVCAILSPILTALINNHHQKKMKILELKAEEKRKLAERKKDIFENYLFYAGSLVQVFDSDGTVDIKELKSFGMYSRRAMCYAPEDLVKDMMELERLIANQVHHEQRKVLDTITLKLRSILQES